MKYGFVGHCYRISSVCAWILLHWGATAVFGGVESLHIYGFYHVLLYTELFKEDHWPFENPPAEILAQNAWNRRYHPKLSLGLWEQEQKLCRTHFSSIPFTFTGTTRAQGSSFLSSAQGHIASSGIPVAPSIKVCSFTPLSSYSWWLHKILMASHICSHIFAHA